MRVFIPVNTKTSHDKIKANGIILCNTIYISLFTLCFDEIHLIGFYFVT